MGTTKTHRIAWKNVVTGFESHGEPCGTKASLENAVDDLNTRWKGLIIHWIEAAPVEAESQTSSA